MPLIVEGKEVACVGDQTTHGSPLAPGPGAITVLYNGRPIWRAQVDFHTCPIVKGTVPDVGGMVQVGAMRTMAMGAMIARKGDIVLETPGGPNPIVMGAMGFGGGGGMAASGAARGAAMAGRVSQNAAFSKRNSLLAKLLKGALRAALLGALAGPFGGLGSLFLAAKYGPSVLGRMAALLKKDGQGLKTGNPWTWAKQGWSVAKAYLPLTSALLSKHWANVSRIGSIPTRAGNVQGVFLKTGKVLKKLGPVVSGVFSAAEATQKNWGKLKSGSAGDKGDAAARIAYAGAKGASSAVAGAAVGAAIGSIVPGAGTVVGAAVGAGVGLIAGYFTSKAAEATIDTAVGGGNAGRAEDNVGNVGRKIGNWFSKKWKGS